MLLYFGFIVGFWNEESGVTVVEYGLIASLCAIFQTGVPYLGAPL